MKTLLIWPPGIISYYFAMYPFPCLYKYTSTTPHFIQHHIFIYISFYVYFIVIVTSLFNLLVCTLFLYFINLFVNISRKSYKLILFKNAVSTLEIWFTDSITVLVKSEFRWSQMRAGGVIIIVKVLLVKV